MATHAVTPTAGAATASTTDEQDPFTGANIPQPYTPPAGTLTARQLLDQVLPDFNITGTGEASQSSGTNVNFENIKKISPNKHVTLFGNDRGGYPSALPAGQFHPVSSVNFGPVTHEAQAVNVCRHYILNPVSQVLAARIGQGNNVITYHVEEEVKGTYKESSGTEKEYSGYVDAAWMVANDYIAFAEFKRPGALVADQWSSNTGLVSKAKTISQQVIKYAYATHKKYFLIGDAQLMIFLRLDDVNDSYVTNLRRRPPGPGVSGASTAQPGSTRSGASVPSQSGWPDITAQAVLSTNQILFKPQLYAFIVKAATAP